MTRSGWVGGALALWMALSATNAAWALPKDVKELGEAEVQAQLRKYLAEGNPKELLEVRDLIVITADNVSFRAEPTDRAVLIWRARAQRTLTRAEQVRAERALHKVAEDGLVHFQGGLVSENDYLGKLVAQVLIRAEERPTSPIAFGSMEGLEPPLLPAQPLAMAAAPPVKAAPMAKELPKTAGPVALPPAPVKATSKGPAPVVTGAPSVSPAPVVTGAPLASVPSGPAPMPSSTTVPMAPVEPHYVQIMVPETRFWGLYTRWRYVTVEEQQEGSPGCSCASGTPMAPGHPVILPE